MECYFLLLDIDECGSWPCQNNGSCVNGVGVYTCNCPSGYTGDQCETSNHCVFDGLSLETLPFIQILTNVNFGLAATAECALMELILLRVSAFLASPEINARRVRVY